MTGYHIEVGYNSVHSKEEVGEVCECGAQGPAFGPMSWEEPVAGCAFAASTGSAGKLRSAALEVDVLRGNLTLEYALEIERMKTAFNEIRRKAVAEYGVRDVTRQLGELATAALKNTHSAVAVGSMPWLDSECVPPAVRSTDWLEPCPKCHRVWGNPTIKHDADDVTFFIRCGSCGHEAPGISLKPAIANWNGSNDVISGGAN